MPKMSVWMIRASLLHLGTGFSIGALILTHKGLNSFPWSWRLLNGHMDILLLGWMVQLAMGVSAWILPRFTGNNRYGRLTLAWAAFIILNTGISLVMGSAWVSGLQIINLIFIGRLLEVLAVFLYALFIIPRVKAFGT